MAILSQLIFSDSQQKNSDAAFAIDTYCGEYCNNRKKGLCTTTLTDGTIISGEFTWQRRKDLAKKKLPVGCLSLDDEVPSGWGYVSYSTAERDGNVVDSPAASCVSYEGDLRDGERDGLGVVRYRFVIHRRHPLLEIAMSAQDGEMQDCIQIVDSATATVTAEEGGEIDPLRDEYGFKGPVASSDTVIQVLSSWGGSYSGGWRRDQPCGFGTMRLVNGQTYSANFS